MSAFVVPFHPTISIRVEARDQAGEARRRALALAQSLGFDQTDSSRLALVVTECATNLVKHAGGGEILLGAAADENRAAVEVLALDKGPGLANLAMCLQDGYSTAGSAGTGLGAVQRVASEFSVYTGEGKGTALLCRIWTKAGKPSFGPRLDAGAVCVPKTGEEVSGDSWAVWQGADSATVMMVDGLGHGEGAAECAAAAMAGFRASAGSPPGDALTAIHGALRPTRGAAVAVAMLDFGRRQVRYSGIGNIAASIHASGSSRQMISYPGIAGHEMRTVRELTYDWPAGAAVLLYSDGIATKWSLGSYEGLALRDPSLIAGVIYRDWTRGRDDATVVVIRERGHV